MLPSMLPLHQRNPDSQDAFMLPLHPFLCIQISIAMATPWNKVTWTRTVAVQNGAFWPWQMPINSTMSSISHIPLSMAGTHLAMFMNQKTHRHRRVRRRRSRSRSRSNSSSSSSSGSSSSNNNKASRVIFDGTLSWHSVFENHTMGLVSCNQKASEQSILNGMFSALERCFHVLPWPRSSSIFL